MASSFNQNGVCLVYIYRAFSLIYCAQLVLAVSKIIFVACVEKGVFCQDNIFIGIFA